MLTRAGARFLDDPMRACTHCRKLVPSTETVCPDDGSPLIEVVFAPLPAELSARFRSAEPFAAGATGELWKVLPAQRDAPALLKVFADSMAGSLSERTRCKRELRKQAGIMQGNLPRVSDAGEAGGKLWMLRDFIPGESLAVRLRRQGALPLAEALAVTAQLASALDELHRQGLVHRDLKPGHVLLSERASGQPIVRLIDAGIAARLPGDALLPSFGTAAYAAPEIALGKPASFRSDLYSLGCTLYEMLSGAPPFVDASVEAVLAAQRDSEPKPLDTELPATVNALLAGLLAKEPRRRPFSAQQVRRTIDPHLPSGMPQIEAAVRSVAPPPPPTAAHMPQGGPDHTQEFSIEEIEMAAASAESTGVTTQELELIDIEPLPPQTRTQELDLADIEPMSLPSVQTQELSLSDIHSLRAPADDKAAAERAATLVQQNKAKAAPARATADKSASLPAAMHPNPRAAERVEYVRNSANDSAPTIALRTDGSMAPIVPAPSGAASAEPRRSFDVEALFKDDEPAPQETADTHHTPAGQGPSTDESSEAPAAESAREPSGQHPIEPAQSPSKTESSGYAKVNLPVPLDEQSPTPTPNASRKRRVSPTPSLREPSGELLIDAADPVPDSAPLTAASYAPVSSASGRPSEAPASDSSRPAGLPSRRRSWLLMAAAVALLALALAIGLAKPKHDERAGSSPATPSATTPKIAVDVALQEPEAPPPSAAAVHVEDSLPPSPVPTPPPSAAAEPAAIPVATVTATTPDAGTNAGPQTVSAVDASRAFLRDGNADVGGVVTYKARKQLDVDYKGKARQLYQAGKFREAADAYQHASMKTPSDAAAFAGLGASWLAAGEPDKALVAYERAVQLKPEVSGFQAALGRAYLAKGDRARASAAYSKALKLDPGNPAAKSGLGSLR